MLTTEWLYTRLGKVLVDASVLSAALWAAYALRFDGDLPPEYFNQVVVFGPYVVLLTLAVLGATGTYNRVWRYTNLSDAIALTAALALPAVLLATLRLVVPDPYRTLRLPFSITSVYFSLGVIGAFGVRAVRRLGYERARRSSRSVGHAVARRVLIIGAGETGIRLARDLSARPDLRVVAFSDDDVRKLGTRIDGIRVSGTTAELPRLVVKHRVDEAIIAFPNSEPDRIRRVIEVCEQIPVRVRIVPSGRPTGHVSGRVREVRVEDLLSRDLVNLETAAVELINTYSNRSILVTGAGGSIGSELCRQLLALNPRVLLLLDQDETNLFEIHSDLIDLGCPPERLRQFIVDVRNEHAMRRLFDTERPEIVLHAAAFKHVPFLEGHIVEAVENNVLATGRLTDLSVEFGVRELVLISTDKAVRPTSVMGATKRTAELVVQRAAVRHGVNFVVVRFGNVLDSRGSVIPLFRRQIARGGPVTITHEDATRFFMTIAEATQLVLRAGALGRAGDIFVLDMGEPVRIVHLARDLIHLSGLREPEDIQLKFVGLRPGERLHEELAEGGGPLLQTKFDKVLAVSPSFVASERVDTLLDDLRDGVRKCDANALLAILSQPIVGLEPRVAAVGANAPGRLRVVPRDDSAKRL